MASPDMRMQISQQLQRYDMAIKRVDDGIAQTKLNLRSWDKPPSSLCICTTSSCTTTRHFSRRVLA